MHDQKEWTHAIPPQPCVKESRISLTFRRVWSSLQQSLDEMERDYSIPPCKRLRREMRKGCSSDELPDNQLGDKCFETRLSYLNRCIAFIDMNNVTHDFVYDNSKL
ncbi:hypothetical protein AVEN_182459-1 [Araneus ventricosus]|uniref:Uncharacterized protein n=1 Tax=Araneus ventricosus TaxID=182803 RepID=A0A4Y2K2B4_ARAVE|nr:hypothetical protein AVEN_182459-1 [Araneus ventricosus]